MSFREAQVDLRPGGRFRWAYDNDDVVVGEFVHIEAPQRLSFRHGWQHPANRDVPPDSTPGGGHAVRTRRSHSATAHAYRPAHRARGRAPHGLGVVPRTARDHRTREPNLERRTKEQAMTESTAAVVDTYYARGVDLYFDPATLRPQSPSNQA